MRMPQIARTLLAQVPTVLTLAALAGLALWGHAHDWKFPRRSALFGPAEEAAKPEGEKPPDGGASEDTRVFRPFKLPSPEAAEKAGITFDKVKERPMGEYVRANGEVAFNHHRIAHLAPRAAGTVWSVEKHEGDKVKKGDVLAIVSAAEVARLKSDLQQARLQVEVRERAFRALQSIAGSAPERQLREAEALLREARVRLEGDRQALLNLGLALRLEELEGLSDEQVAHRLRALGLPDDIASRAGGAGLPADLLPLYSPFDGTVVRRDAVQGEVVTTTQPLFTVADLREVTVLLYLRVEDANRVAEGQEVTFHPDGGGETKGRLRWVSAEVDEKTRTVRARALVPNPAGRLRPRAFGHGEVLVRPLPNAVAVPDAAIQWEGKTALVFVQLSEAEVQPREVRPGVKHGGYTQVLAGVQPGEVIAVAGSHVLLSQMLSERIGGGD